MNEYEIEIEFDNDGIFHSRVSAWNLTDAAGKAIAEGRFALIGRKVVRGSVRLIGPDDVR